MQEKRETALYFQLAGDTAAQTVRGLLALNETLGAYGLTLSSDQARALSETQARVLRQTGRLEFGEGIAGKLAAAFGASPYLATDTFEDALHELIELFYLFKNETDDRVSDDALVSYMQGMFDGDCRGSLSALSEEALPALVRRLNARAAAAEHLSQEEVPGGDA